MEGNSKNPKVGYSCDRKTARISIPEARGSRAQDAPHTNFTTTTTTAADENIPNTIQFTLLRERFPFPGLCYGRIGTLFDSAVRNAREITAICDMSGKGK